MEKYNMHYPWCEYFKHLTIPLHKSSQLFIEYPNEFISKTMERFHCELTLEAVQPHARDKVDHAQITRSRESMFLSLN